MSSARKSFPALVAVGLLPIRKSPAHESERVTDAPLGTPLTCTGGPRDDWWKVTLPDGYKGYARTVGLVECPPKLAARYSSAPLVASQSGSVLAAPRGQVRVYVPAGARLPVLKPGRDPGVELPSGESGVFAGKLQARPRAFQREAMVRHALSFLGVPYLWGGTTGWGLDCSGLVQLSASLAGLKLPRDSRDQFKAGRPVGARRSEDLVRGDLLFFGADLRHVSHVGIFLWEGLFVHARGSVRVNSLRPEDATYQPELLKIFQGARRVGSRNR